MAPLAVRRRIDDSALLFAAAVACGLGLVLYVVLLSTTAAGRAPMINGLESVAETASALFAVAACARAAWRSRGRVRTAWWLMAAASAAWSIASATAFYYRAPELNPTVPEINDIAGFLGSLVAVAAVLAFPAVAGNAAERFRAVLDGLIVAAAVLFIVWVLGLDAVWATSPRSQLRTCLALLDPAADVLALTILAVAVRRSIGEMRFVAILLAATFIAKLTGDSAAALTTLHGDTAIVGDQLSAGLVVGFELLGLAAIWSAPTNKAREEAASTIWQLALPWVAVAAFMATAAWRSAIGRPLDASATGIAVVVGSLFVISQALVLRDTFELIERSRRSEAKLLDTTTLLTDMISRAPLGIAKIGLNLRVIDANARLQSMLLAPAQILIGSSMIDYLTSEGLQDVVAKFEPIRNGSEESVEGDSLVVRADRSTTWLHWTVVAIRTRKGAIDYFLGMYEDITERHLAEVELNQRTNLLNAVIERSPVGISRLSPELTVLGLNSKMAGMLGVSAASQLGSSILGAVPAGAKEHMLARIASLARGEVENLVLEGPVLRSDGTELWMRRTITAVRAAGGQVEYYLVIGEDETERHRLERLAAENLAGLERLSKLKSEFMSMVSHEFRTALTGIQGYSELMTIDEVSPEEVKEFSTDINRDALRLNRMITEMLDLDRVESGRITLNLAPLDLNQILSEAADRARVSTAKHVIKTDLDPRVRPVTADSDRVIQVVTNLLSNAVKYSPNGGEVLVSSRLAGGDVEVIVKDHGPGIPPEFIGKIFGRYERYEGKGKAQVVGTGLGLAISQQIVQLHKGRMWVESKVGEGSAFHFTLPVTAGLETHRAVLHPPEQAEVA